MRRKFTFLIPVPQEIQDTVSKTIQLLRKGNPVNNKNSLSWLETTPTVPLIYLGALSEEAKEAAKEAGLAASKQIKPFEISFGTVSYLYSDKKAPGSLIFLDLLDKQKQMKNLQKILANELRERGFSPATHFVPHLPIGRLTKLQEEHERMRILDEVAQVEISPVGSFNINRFDLVAVTQEDVLTQKTSLINSFPLN